MSEEEIQAEIDAARAERRARSTKSFPVRIVAERHRVDLPAFLIVELEDVLSHAKFA